jgi:hypothetical protein
VALPVAAGAEIGGVAGGVETVVAPESVVGVVLTTGLALLVAGFDFVALGSFGGVANAPFNLDSSPGFDELAAVGADEFGVSFGAIVPKSIGDLWTESRSGVVEPGPEVAGGVGLALGGLLSFAFSTGFSTGTLGSVITSWVAAGFLGFFFFFASFSAFSLSFSAWSFAAFCPSISRRFSSEV